MAAPAHAPLTCSTHRHFLAEADLRQDLLDALSAPHLPDGGFHMLVGDWPVPGLELIPNSSERKAKPQQFNSSFFQLKSGVKDQQTSDPVHTQNLPEGVHVSGSGKGKLALAVTWAHFAYNLRSEITDPAMRQLQLVLSPEGHFNRKRSVIKRCSRNFFSSRTSSLLSIDVG